MTKATRPVCQSILSNTRLLLLQKQNYDMLPSFRKRLKTVMKKLMYHFNSALYLSSCMKKSDFACCIFVIIEVTQLFNSNECSSCIEMHKLHRMEFKTKGCLTSELPYIYMQDRSMIVEMD